MANRNIAPASQWVERTAAAASPIKGLFVAKQDGKYGFDTPTTALAMFELGEASMCAIFDPDDGVWLGAPGGVYGVVTSAADVEAVIINNGRQTPYGIETNVGQKRLAARPATAVLIYG